MSLSAISFFFKFKVRVGVVYNLEVIFLDKKEIILCYYK